MNVRTAEKERKTLETKITVKVSLDGSGKADIDTPYGFLNHMLEQLSLHSGIDIKLHAEGDTKVDPQHTVEDTAITRALALDEALKDRVSIERYGWTMLVMDETRCDVAMDIGGRGCLIYNVQFPVPWDREDDFDYSLIKEFMNAFSRNLKATIHINLICGDNNHHIAEAIFKGLARSLKQAVAVEGVGVPSTKGVV